MKWTEQPLKLTFMQEHHPLYHLHFELWREEKKNKSKVERLILAIDFYFVDPVYEELISKRG